MSNAEPVSHDALTARFQDQYLGKRAREIATTRAATVLQEQIRKAESTLVSLKQMATQLGAERRGAAGAADALRVMAKSLGVDLSDEIMGPKLVEAANTDTAAVFQALGMSAERSSAEILSPRSPQKPAAEDPGANLPPAKGVVTTVPRFRPVPKAKTETADEVEEVAKTPSETPEVKPGRISTVTPRAAAAMARFRKGAKDERGVTHRSDALTDSTGRQIPVNEMIVVDDDAPAPEAGSEGDGKVGTTHLDDDPPEA